MDKCGLKLDDESFRIFTCETVAIINSRPLTVDNLTDQNSLEPLTPNHLITLKSKIIVPHPGNFQREDLYTRDGEESNTLRMNFGHDGERNFFRHNKFVLSGYFHNEIFALQMLFSSVMKINQEMTGDWVVLQKPIREKVDVSVV